MRTLQYTVPAAFDGRPLKHLLRGELGISSTLLKTLKWREGAILLNGAGVHVNAVVRTGVPRSSARGRLALRHRGSGAHRPPRTALVCAVVHPPAHTRGPALHRAAAGGYGTADKIRRLAEPSYFQSSLFSIVKARAVLTL